MSEANEQAIIVRYDIFAGIKNHSEASDEALGELNSLLANGWRVKHGHSMRMGETDVRIGLCSLVILER